MKALNQFSVMEDLRPIFYHLLWNLPSVFGNFVISHVLFGGKIIQKHAVPSR